MTIHEIKKGVEMTENKKKEQKQVRSFYVTPEAAAILASLPDGTRSAFINAAIVAAAQKKE